MRKVVLVIAALVASAGSVEAQERSWLQVCQEDERLLRLARAYNLEQLSVGPAPDTKPPVCTTTIIGYRVYTTETNFRILEHEPLIPEAPPRLRNSRPRQWKEDHEVFNRQKAHSLHRAKEALQHLPPNPHLHHGPLVPFEHRVALLPPRIAYNPPRWNQKCRTLWTYNTHGVSC